MVSAGNHPRCCVTTVSKPYLFSPLGLAFERKADAPSYCKETKMKEIAGGYGVVSRACKAGALPAELHAHVQPFDCNGVFVTMRPAFLAGARANNVHTRAIVRVCSSASARTLSAFPWNPSITKCLCCALRPAQTLAHRAAAWALRAGRDTCRPARDGEFRAQPLNVATSML